MKESVSSSIDIGDWAKHYATRPYGHYKQEVYELFIDILGCLSSNSRILDVGAGPGHLTCEYFKRYRQSRSQFVLLDVSERLLNIAESRLRSKAGQIKTFLRDYNSKNWDKGIGKFDAIVSDNSLFHVWPEHLESFYATCFSRLKKNDIMLREPLLRDGVKMGHQE